MVPLNGWNRTDDAEAIALGRRLATLHWLASRRGLDPTHGVLFYRSGRAWLLSCRDGTAEFGAHSWGARTIDRDVAIREAWADATGRQTEPEVQALRARLDAALSPPPLAAPHARYENADREQLALLGRT